MSIKVLHTANWHLGKKLDHFSRMEEQIQVLNEICDIAEEQKVDAVIVAGDLFDTFNPPVEAIDLFYKTLKRLTHNASRPVIAISGNHDSPDRIDAPNPLAKECGIIFVGNPDVVVPIFQIENGFEVIKSEQGFIELKLPKFQFNFRLLLTPYVNEQRLKIYLGSENKDAQLNDLLSKSWSDIAEKYCDTDGVNFLTSHLYMLKRDGEILEEPEGEKPLRIGNADIIYTDCIPKQIQYTALGHLHRYQKVGGHVSPVVYSSSPLGYSFSESEQTKHVVIVEAEPNKEVKLTPIPLKSGRGIYRKRFEKIDDAIEWLVENPYSLVELTLISETFLSNEELKRIYQSHDGIIHIIPIISSDSESAEKSEGVNLDQDMEGLFKDYFKSKNKAVEPNEEILALFKEVLGSQNVDLN
jgi:exonuclease SbcD